METHNEPRPIESMTQDEIDAEIAELLKQKMMDEDAMLLLMAVYGC